MPVLRFKPERLLRRLGVSLETLQALLFRLKCETDILDDGSLEVEVNPDRPDMYSEEGIIRAVSGLIGSKRGWNPPRTVNSEIELRVLGSRSRPYIVAGVVYNVNIEDEDDLLQIIQFQEKLHDTIGRRRRKVAIGLHDLDKLPSNRLSYGDAPIGEVSFVPLGGEEEFSAEEVLEETEQGRKYGNISLHGGMHPFLWSGDKVIAMPPVINSNITRIEPGTKHLFIDVTGTDPSVISKVLDIIVTNLAERRGAEVGLVKILNNGESTYTPALKTTRYTLSLDYVNKTLGYSTNPLILEDALSRMRYNVISVAEKSLQLEVPPFRADIISEIDLVEDIAIALGYETLYPVAPFKPTRGGLLAETRIARAVRTLLIGLGFTEMKQLMLTGPGTLNAMGLESISIRVSNPVQQEYSILRPRLAVSLLSILRENQHAKKPVKIFEIGRVAYKKDNMPTEEERVAIALMDDEVSVEMIQSPLYAALDSLGISFKVRQGCREPYLLSERCGTILIGDLELGYFGEVNPSTLEKLQVEYPVAVAELSLEVLAKWRSKMRNPTSI